MTSPRRRIGSLVAALGTVVVLVLGILPVSTASAVPDESAESPAPPAMPANGVAVLGLDKQVNPSTLAPGQETEYRLVVSCSSLEVPCVDLVLEDVLPADFEVTSLPSSNSQRTVEWDPTSQLLRVIFIIPLGGGQVGLPAGSSQTVSIGVRLPIETPVTDGQVIPNTATATATAATPAQDTALVTAEIPVRYDARSTKSWSPDSGLAGSGSAASVTLGVRNASSSSSPVNQITVADTTAATFDRFDLTGAGVVELFPDGANQVIVETCQRPVGTPCSDAEWVTSSVQTGPLLTLPAGVAASAVTGIRYRFSNSGGAALPYSPTPGRVSTPFVLRSTLRSTGAPLEPLTTELVTNCASPSVRAVAGGSTAGDDACAVYAIQPGDVRVTAAKAFFSDSNGDYRADGSVVAGQDSGVSMRVTATNDSAFPVSVMRLREPSPSAVTDFSKVDLTRGRITFPAGATSADLVVDCRSGADPAPQTIPRPASGDLVNLATLGCAPGVAAASVTVTFTGVVGGNTAVIAPGAAGILELHGTAPGASIADVTDGGLLNCAEVTLSSQIDGTGSATSDACASVAVVAPNPGVGSGTKSTNGVTTMTAGQDLTFNLSFRNSGNVPVTNVVLVDPPDPTAAGNPFGVVRLTSLRAVTATPASDLEVYDPTAGDYVPYVATDAGLLARATGIRVRVTGSLGVGDTFRVAYSVRLRDGVAPSTTFRNCAAVGIDVPTQNFCGPTISAAPPSSGGSFNKSLSPASVIRPQPGLADQIVDVRHRVTNTGTLNLKRLVVTDVDADFFDAVDYVGQIRVNFPVGANRVQVDACTSVANCTNGTWVLGTRTASATPSVPAGAAGGVKGLRFTFTSSTNGYDLLPSPNYPSSGGCPNATVCFRVKVRQNLASSPSTPVPASLIDTSDAAGESQLQPSGTTFAIPPASATVTVNEGTPALSLSKGPESRIGPGDVAPLSLVTTNTGTDAVTNPTVVDPLPAGLTFDPTITGGSPGAPYLINYVLPAGVSPPASVVFTAQPGSPVSPPVPGCTDVNRVCRLSWSFPNWTLPPGGRIEIQFNVVLTPGVLAGEVLTNTAGTSGTNPNLICAGTSVVNNSAYGPGRFCTASTTVTTLAGDDFIAEKWIAADPALGLRNAAGQVVSLDDPSCPKYLDGDRVYTRYPCTARVRAGGTIDYLIRGVNSGTNPATQVVLVDGLPVQGDVGVLLSGQARGTQWNQRPTMLSGVTNIEGYPGVTTGYTNAPFPSSAFCTSNLSRPPADTCPPTAFSAPLGADVTGFRTTMAFPSDDLLDPGESFSLVWSMQAPLDLNSALSEPVAWNSFAYRPSFRLPGGQTTVLPATEPLKVGVGMPLGRFSATKSVQGLPPGVPLAPFEMAFACEITTADDIVTEVASGTFTLVDGATYVGPLVPDGASCRVWETNSQGGQSNMAGEESAVVVTITSGGDPVPVAVLNEFGTGALTVSKTVVWDNVPPVPIPGPFVIDVSCSFPGPSDLLPGFPQQIALNDGESSTITDLPVGATCDLTEIETREAMEVTMAPSNAPVEEGSFVTVLIDEYDVADPVSFPGTEVDVTNTYTTGGVVVTKELTGAASEWAQGPYVMRVACTDPLGGLDPVIEEVTLSPDDLTATVSPIPADYVCTVDEINAGDAVTTTISPAGAFSIPRYDPDPPGPVEVTVTNEYPAGSISVAKVLDGAAAGPMATAEFTLRLQCERDLINGEGVQVFLDEELTLRGGQQELVDDSIPLGSRCWVTETNSVGATEVDISATVDNKVTVSQANDDVTITATNTYVPGGSRAGSDDSGIRLTKVLVGEGTRWAAGPFTFATTCTLAGFTLPPFPEVTLDLDVLVGYVNPIPVGAQCTVVETNDGAATGDVPRVVGTVTLPAADQPAVDVVATNEFPVATLEVAKVVEGAGPAGVFGIDVYCSIGTARLDLTNGSSPFVLTDAPSARLEIAAGASSPLVVPVGATCAVTEPDARGATATLVTVENGQSPDGFAVSGPTRVVVTNRYDPNANGLPATGASGMGTLWLAMILIVGGALLVGVIRRRGVPATG